ncbi:MerR family transcriptional regulator [Acetatifactor aquisgranensis]|uniref:MerR family transcriptional regulator n=1 Tax=Acetatifactor aquisgranensis TaxID=2941233 RepID=UPI00203FFFDE|nr:MerR family transcriptional regulator [Acetatifactor aquisgranensis]MCI8543705.1 MerR family transcriptional regulator [Lachnospiraceae bacterium]
MLRIGDFSKLSRISIRMLRHYDECGLLKPEMVDSFTGYRYYGESQLLGAGRIQALRSMGFGVAAIGEILEKYADGGELEQFLVRKRDEMETQYREMRQKMRLIDSTIEWLRKDGSIMGYDVSLKTLPERYVASVRMVIPGYDSEHILWKTLMEETAGMHLQDGSPCYTMAIFHDGEYKERNVDVEVQKSVAGNYQDRGHVKFKTEPPVQIASATYRGSYEQIGQVNSAVAKWIEDNGYEMNGLSFNIYHVSPHETQNPEEYVTEVCYPVRKK